MIDKAAMRDELTRDEGRRARPYVDTVGKVTIGVGRNLTDRGLRDSEIDLMLNNDIAESESELDRVAPWWRKMSDVRQRVLLNMHFNLGWARLSQFHDALFAMESGDYAAAATAMLASKWASQVGERAKRLYTMMKTGAV